MASDWPRSSARHAEIALNFFFGVAALLVANHHARLTVESRQPANDRLVVGEPPITVQLFKSGEDILDIVVGIGSLRMACDLGDLPRGELRVNVLGERLSLDFETADFFRNVYGRFVLRETKLFDLRFQLGNRLFKFEKCRFHSAIVATPETQTPSAASREGVLVGSLALTYFLTRK
jgi:hypothetical protein